jgi:hypothetical protein
LVALALLGAACPNSLAKSPPKEPNEPQLSRLLDEALAGEGKLDHVRVTVQWSDGKGGRSVRVYGNGVGIWNNKSQFTLQPAEVERLLGLFRTHKFTDMPARVGSQKAPPGRERPVRVAGSVALSVGGVTKEVTQAAGRQPSKPLAVLAAEVLKTSEAAAAEDGVSADDVGDGLRKIAEGELAPEALRVLVHRLTDKPGADEASGADGFLLRLDGRTVTTQRWRKRTGYGKPRRLDLSPEDLAGLCKLLADNDAGGLPINLWAKHYTDVVITVLDKEKSVQARQFAGMTPKTHGEKQKRFDRIWAGMHALHQRVLGEGKPAMASGERG